MKIIRRFLYLLAALLLISCTEASKKEHLLAESERAKRMQSFITDLSVHAKKSTPGFLIVPQNGSMLAFDSANPTKNINESYLNAIDAIGIEALYYNGIYEPDSLRIGVLQQLAAKKKILVSEFVDVQNAPDDAALKNHQNGFVPFIRSADNMHYEQIPKKIRGENSDNITKMSQVKNYLYLINPSQFRSRKQYIDALSKTNHDLIIIDLFFDGNEPLRADETARLKRKANGGDRLVLCYINIGAAENWRYYWESSWKKGNPKFLARKYHGYANEFWVRYWDKSWQEIIFRGSDSYLSKITAAGFDGAYLDNVEAYKYLYSDQ